jgi:hypothetical protein
MTHPPSSTYEKIDSGHSLGMEIFINGIFYYLLRKEVNMANGVQGQVQKPMVMNSAGGNVGVGSGMIGNETQKSKKWLWIGIGIVVLLVIIGVVWWALSK